MSQTGRYLLVPMLLFSVHCSGQQADTNQWTRFRGFNGLGIENRMPLPTVWDTADFLWDISLPGVGHASPVVWGDQIFVTGSDDTKKLGYVTAVDQQTGKLLWQKEFILTDLTMHVDNNLASATPAIDQSQLYVVWYSKEKTTLTALGHDGVFHWESTFGGIESRHGGGSSLMLTDSYVVFTREQETGSTLKSSWVAVNKETGETGWELERETAEGNSFSTPVLVKNDNHPTQLIFTSQAHGFTGVDPESGAVLWERKELLPHRVVASPLYAGGMVIGCRKGEGVVIAFDSHSQQAADSVRYRLPPSLSPYVPTPIVVGSLLFLFMDNGTVACILLSTGEVIWKERPAGPIYGSPVCVNGNLYCITKEGEVLVIGADPEYRLKGIHALGEGSFSTPVMCRSGMVFRTYSKLMLLGNSP